MLALEHPEKRADFLRHFTYSRQDRHRSNIAIAALNRKRTTVDKAFAARKQIATQEKLAWRELKIQLIKGAIPCPLAF